MIRWAYFLGQIIIICVFYLAIMLLFGLVVQVYKHPCQMFFQKQKKMIWPGALATKDENENDHPPLYLVVSFYQNGC